MLFLYLIEIPSYRYSKADYGSPYLMRTFHFRVKELEPEADMLPTAEVYKSGPYPSIPCIKLLFKRSIFILCVVKEHAI